MAELINKTNFGDAHFCPFCGEHHTDCEYEEE